MSTVMDTVAGKGRSQGANLWLLVLALSLVVSVALVISAANAGNALWKSSGFGGAITAALNLQVNSQKLSNLGREAVNGDAGAFKAFRDTKAQMETDVRQLNDRFGSAPDVSGPINLVITTWVPMSKSADQIIASEEAVVAFAGNAKTFTDRVPQLQVQLDEVVRAMSASGARSSQIYIAMRQVVLAATMARSVAEIRAGGPYASVAGKRLARDADFFARVLNGLRNGDQEINIQRLANPAELGALNQANAQWADMKKDLDVILGSSQNIFRAQSAATELMTGSVKLLSDSESLFRAFTALSPARDTNIFDKNWIGVVAASNLQVNSQKLSNLGREAVNGDAWAFKAFRVTKAQIETDVKQLNARFGSAPDVSGPINTVTTTWVPMGKSADQIISSEAAVVALADNAKTFTDRLPLLQVQLDEVVRAMSASGAPSSQIYIALRQIVLTATMARSLAEIRAGGPNASVAGERLARDSGAFAQVLNGLRNGDQEMNIHRLASPAALGALNQANAQWADMKKDLDVILGSSQNIFRAQSAATELTTGSAKLLSDSESLFRAFVSSPVKRTHQK